MACDGIMSNYSFCLSVRVVSTQGGLKNYKNRPSSFRDGNGVGQDSPLVGNFFALYPFTVGQSKCPVYVPIYLFIWIVHFIASTHSSETIYGY